nr:uncharacterized aarF domain-containing protein kinase At5g05200, chloroplastic-like [Malus domestica]
MILISFFTHYVKSSKQLNCNSNSRGFTLFARYSQAQDLYSSRLQDRFEDLPKLVEDILQTLVSTGPRGALRMVQGIQAFIGVGGEWLADVSKSQDAVPTICLKVLEVLCICPTFQMLLKYFCLRLT